MRRGGRLHAWLHIAYQRHIAPPTIARDMAAGVPQVADTYRGEICQPSPLSATPRGTFPQVERGAADQKGGHHNTTRPRREIYSPPRLVYPS